MSAVVLIDENNNRLDIDATVKEVKNYENVITSFPVEDGSEISDSVIKKNKKFSITGIISQTPIVQGQLQVSPDYKWNDIVGKLKSVFGANLTTETAKLIAPDVTFTTNVSDARTFLENIRDNVLFFTIQYRKIINNEIQIEQSIDNCIVRSLEINADNTTGNDLYFTLIAEQVVISSSKVASVKVVHADRAAKSVDKGHVSPQTNPTPDPANSDGLSFVRGN